MSHAEKQMFDIFVLSEGSKAEAEAMKRAAEKAQRR